jgi:predicted ABC-type ATPase
MCGGTRSYVSNRYTIQESTGGDWVTYQKKPGTVIYEISSRTGRWIAPISKHPDEDEVLFAPRARFRVTEVERSVERWRRQRREVIRIKMEESGLRKFSAGDESAGQLAKEGGRHRPAPRFFAEPTGFVPVDEAPPLASEEDERLLELVFGPAHAEFAKGDWDESKHPRDDHGRFVFSTGGDVRRALKDPDIRTAYDLNKRTPQYVASEEEKRRIAEEVFRKCPDSLPRPGEPKRAVILLGPPGSGKTAQNEVPDRGRLLLINADDIQEHLSGYEPELAPSYHEAGADIAEKYVLKPAMDEGRNFEVQWVGKTASKVQEMVQRLKRDGYRVELYYMHVTPEESAMRAIRRFRNPNDRRFAPPRYALKLGDRPRQTYESVKQMLDPETDRWAFFDNMVPMGEKPKLVERGGKWD